MSFVAYFAHSILYLFILMPLSCLLNFRFLKFIHGCTESLLLIVVSGDHSSLWSVGFLSWWLLVLPEHGLYVWGLSSCPEACGICPHQEWNLCSLPWGRPESPCICIFKLGALFHFRVRSCLTTLELMPKKEKFLMGASADEIEDECKFKLHCISYRQP